MQIYANNTVMFSVVLVFPLNQRVSDCFMAILFDYFTFGG